MSEWIIIFVDTPLPKAFEWIPVANSIILFGIIAGALIKYSSWRGTEEQRKRAKLAEQKALVITACEEFTNSPAYRKGRDERSREITDSRVDEAFRLRASTFVDAKVYESETRAFRADIARLSEDIKENTRTLAQISGQLSMSGRSDQTK